MSYSHYIAGCQSLYTSLRNKGAPVMECPDFNAQEETGPQQKSIPPGQ